MGVDFIFQFIFYPSGGHNDCLPHHKGEKAGQQRTADQYTGIDKDNSEVGPVISNVFQKTQFF